MSGSNEPEKLRKDLETIKDLLDEENKIPPEPIVDDEDIPTLDDSLEEARTALPESTFKTLLSDAWRESVQELFQEGSKRVDLPQDIDALSDALKLRIDKSVREWLQETLSANVDVLRQRMVHELSEELLLQLRAIAEAKTANADAKKKDV